MKRYAKTLKRVTFDNYRVIFEGGIKVPFKRGDNVQDVFGSNSAIVHYIGCEESVKGQRLPRDLTLPGRLLKINSDHYLISYIQDPLLTFNDTLATLSRIMHDGTSHVPFTKEEEGWCDSMRKLFFPLPLPSKNLKEYILECYRDTEDILNELHVGHPLRLSSSPFRTNSLTLRLFESILRRTKTSSHVGGICSIVVNEKENDENCDEKRENALKLSLITASRCFPHLVPFYSDMSKRLYYPSYVYQRAFFYRFGTFGHGNDEDEQVFKRMRLVPTGIMNGVERIWDKAEDMAGEITEELYDIGAFPNNKVMFISGKKRIIDFTRGRGYPKRDKRYAMFVNDFNHTKYSPHILKEKKND
jgi:hypothetical protein